MTFGVVVDTWRFFVDAADCCCWIFWMKWNLKREIDKSLFHTSVTWGAAIWKYWAGVWSWFDWDKIAYCCPEFCKEKVISNNDHID